ncbi:unnamed protein product, partial [Durusdinium trenchii]
TRHEASQGSPGAPSTRGNRTSSLRGREGARAASGASGPRAAGEGDGGGASPTPRCTPGPKRSTQCCFGGASFSASCNNQLGDAGSAGSTTGTARSFA